MRLGAQSILVAACAAATLILAPQVDAQERATFDLEPLADEDLGNLRGGFFTVDGYAFDFGAVVRTTIDGQPALEQRLTWTPDGVTIDNLAGGPAHLPGIGGVGFNLSDASGTTLVGHRLVDGHLQGFIINSGNDRNIGQDIQVDLTLPAFDAVQKDILSGRLGMRIDMDMASGLVSASGQ
ncbi:MAG: hypothetical protein EON93_03035 [Burkholderiales bacterium]|nr:MAG: hypothetical protein EON93_03035 [Burkholderiales bacterium]